MAIRYQAVVTPVAATLVGRTNITIRRWHHRHHPASCLPPIPHADELAAIDFALLATRLSPLKRPPHAAAFASQCKWQLASPAHVCTADSEAASINFDMYASFVRAASAGARMRATAPVTQRARCSLDRSYQHLAYGTRLPSIIRTSSNQRIASNRRALMQAIPPPASL